MRSAETFLDQLEDDIHDELMEALGGLLKTISETAKTINSSEVRVDLAIAVSGDGRANFDRTIRFEVWKDREEKLRFAQEAEENG